MAVKKLLDDHRSSNERQFRHEINVLRNLRDDAIVRFLGASVTEGHVLLLMEYMAGGTLHHAIQGDNPGRFLWPNR